MDFELFLKLHLLMYASQFKISQIIPLSFLLSYYSAFWMKYKELFTVFEGLLFGEKINNGGQNL